MFDVWKQTELVHSNGMLRLVQIVKLARLRTSDIILFE